MKNTNYMLSYLCVQLAELFVAQRFLFNSSFFSPPIFNLGSVYEYFYYLHTFSGFLTKAY